jgi:major membrane immunogen (membrane-anchored lipoprotein)
MRSIVAATVLTMILGAVSFLLAGCGEQLYEFQDGYYTAVQKEGEHGWTEYVTINVKNGKIVTMEFQATNASGFIKSWDLDYMRIMNATDGTYPNEYVRILTKDFLEKQNADVDVVTGATNSSTSFLKLSAAVVEQSRQGNTDVILVDTGSGEEAVTEAEPDTETGTGEGEPEVGEEA